MRSRIVIAILPLVICNQVKAQQTDPFQSVMPKPAPRQLTPKPHQPQPNTSSQREIAPKRFSWVVGHWEAVFSDMKSTCAQDRGTYIELSPDSSQVLVRAGYRPDMKTSDDVNIYLIDEQRSNSESLIKYGTGTFVQGWFKKNSDTDIVFAMGPGVIHFRKCPS